jgi:hypothetical protein
MAEKPHRSWTPERRAELLIAVDRDTDQREQDSLREGYEQPIPLRSTLRDWVEQELLRRTFRLTSWLEVPFLEVGFLKAGRPTSAPPGRRELSATRAR